MPHMIQITPMARERLKVALNMECDMRLPSGVLDELIDMGRAYSLRRGETVIPFGSVDTNIYIIMDGIIRTWYFNGEQEITQAFGEEGTIAISYHSYYAGEPSSVGFEACCSSKVLKISKEDYEALVARNNIFARWNVRLMQCQLYHYEIKRKVINGTAKEKYLAFIHHRPELIRKVPLKIIATYLNITPEYLSKLRRLVHE